MKILLPDGTSWICRHNGILLRYAKDPNIVADEQLESRR